MAYGTIIPNLTIDGQPAPYGVVNERAIRAAAGIMFAIGIGTFFFIRTTGDYAALFVVVPLFWLDFLLKTISPAYSIFGMMGQWVVRKQKPEWIGAVQKRFAWSIGLALASVMLVTSVFLGVRGWLPLTICMTCLAFMWMESAFGICVGCKIYNALLRAKLIPAPEYQPACPGGACSVQR